MVRAGTEKNKLIKSLKSRNTTFVKRTKGLKKKAFELATLCDIDVCMICFGLEGNQQHKPMIWPEDQQEFSRIIDRYQDLSEEEKNRQKLNLWSLLEKRKEKLEDDLRKKQSDTANPSWENQLNDMPEELLQSLLVKLDEKLEAVNRKIEMLQCKDRKEIKVVNGMKTDHNQLQEMYMQMDSNLMQLQPIQPFPISYLNPLDLCPMSNGNSCKLSIPTYVNNTGLLLPPQEACYGNQGIEIFDVDYKFHPQMESWEVEDFNKFIEPQPPVMGPPCPPLLPPPNPQPLSTLFLHQAHRLARKFFDIQ